MHSVCTHKCFNCTVDLLPGTTLFLDKGCTILYIKKNFHGKRYRHMLVGQLNSVQSYIHRAPNHNESDLKV